MSSHFLNDIISTGNLKTKYKIAWSNLTSGLYSDCLNISQNGQTPLMLAAEQGSLEIVQELIRRGANVNLDDVVSKFDNML